MKKEGHAMPADADKTLKIRRPWSLKRKRLLKWAAIGATALILSAAIVVVLQMHFCTFDDAVSAIRNQPKDSGPAAGVPSSQPASPADPPAPQESRPTASPPASHKPPSGPTVVIEVPKPIGFDASSCRRSQWKRTRRGFVFDIRCVRIIHPQPRQGQ